jgi:hypothetical protein
LEELVLNDRGEHYRLHCGEDTGGNTGKASRALHSVLGGTWPIEPEGMGRQIEFALTLVIGECVKIGLLLSLLHDLIWCGG